MSEEAGNRILLFGGTTEGRRMAQSLARRGFRVTVCVASETGAEYLSRIPGLEIKVGRKDAGQMLRILQDLQKQQEQRDLQKQQKQQVYCIDATHPYAVEATRMIRTACDQAGVPCWRLLRQQISGEEMKQLVFSRMEQFWKSGSHKTEHKDPLEVPGSLSDSVRLRYCDSAKEACQMLMETGSRSGPILITTGAKEAACFTPLLECFTPLLSSDMPSGAVPEVYIRILPSADSIRLCRDAGFPEDHILTGTGPFSVEENVRVLRKLRIRSMVTKDGGIEGGYPEKLAAAALCKAEVIVIRRPREEGLTEEEILKLL